MGMLIAGVLLFSAIHLLPSLGAGLRGTLRQRLGEGGYKGLFSLTVLAAMALIVFGWRSTVPAGVYAPIPELRLPGLGLMLVAFLLLVVSSRPSRLKQWIRHPQLTGIALWAIAHLMLNGDNRSLILFGGLGLWAVLEMLTISHREGARSKPEPSPWSADIANLVVASVIVLVVVYLHPWIAGVPVL